ncbi:RNA polymerase sigma factor [Bacillus sp. Bva_UNVM-123]|uniref:RNA polymerase sigma factor n=1 Tax=Bacillus sp. Bva_UNVM-123 TaxID=2829798 RepID=UPI00391FBCA3
MMTSSLDIRMKEICEQYQKRLFHVAYGITRDYYLAQDIVQETFIKAYQKLEMVEDEEKLGAWLSTIATRTAIDFIRKESRVNERLDNYIDIEKTNVKMSQNVELEVEMNFVQNEITNYINDLPSDQKRVYELKNDFGLKEREIADILMINQNTVKTRLYRIRKQLREMLLNKELA